MPTAVIRPARADELEDLRVVERAAGTLFRDLDMLAVAEDDPPSIAVLSEFQLDGRAWVATGDDDRPVGYLLLGVVDGDAHVEQVSVHPDWSGHGLGRSLVDTGAAWGVARGMHAMTLTTFRDVPWNAPYYARRLGFRVLERPDWGPELMRLREDEVARGLDAWPRVAMLRTL